MEASEPLEKEKMKAKSTADLTRRVSATLTLVDKTAEELPFQLLITANNTGPSARVVQNPRTIKPAADAAPNVTRFRFI